MTTDAYTKWHIKACEERGLDPSIIGIAELDNLMKLEPWVPKEERKRRRSAMLEAYEMLEAIETFCTLFAIAWNLSFDDLKSWMIRE